jgi:hypothetical protein
MKFKIQVLNDKPFKDEIEVNLSDIYFENELSKIKYNIFENMESEIGVSNYFADIIIDKLEGFIND